MKFELAAAVAAVAITTAGAAAVKPQNDMPNLVYILNDDTDGRYLRVSSMQFTPFVP